jgi:hypothetical protein
MDVYTQQVDLEAGQPMGGYAGERLSIQPSDSLEVNGWSFTDAATGETVELCSLDALYAGDLVRRLGQSPHRRLFAASHTHYGPMLDSAKPQLGALAIDAMDAVSQAIIGAERRTIVLDRCRFYRAEVPVPIYRRFDAPDSSINRWLTGHAGMYPNLRQPIDRHLYLFEFAAGGATSFVLALHACHPVSRANRFLMSPDYVGAVRSAVRERFGSVPCLFLLGCAGDIRPNFARKRVAWLPRNRANWRFEWPISITNQDATDRAYAEAVAQASLWHSLNLGDAPVRLEHRVLDLQFPEPIDVPCLILGDCLRLEFVPFEVSHLFHLDAQRKDPMHFIVSCADRTRGYLPHPRQIAAGGYEVDGSRSCMGLAERVLLKDDAIW